MISERSKHDNERFKYTNKNNEAVYKICRTWELEKKKKTITNTNMQQRELEEKKTITNTICNNHINIYMYIKCMIYIYISYILKTFNSLNLPIKSTFLSQILSMSHKQSLNTPVCDKMDLLIFVLRITVSLFLMLINHFLIYHTLRINFPPLVCLVINSFFFCTES